MAKGIVINFLSDVRDFLRGTDDVEGALDDVAGSLEDVAKDGDKAAEKLSDSFRENIKEVSRAAREAGDGIGSDLRRGTKEAEGGMKDLKEESLSTAKESAASFDGSAQSITDAFQEVAANAFVGFGTAGVVAGLAAAGGMGLASAAIISAQEEAQKATDRVNEFGQAIIDSGYDSAALDNFQQSLRNIVGETEDAVVKISDLDSWTKKYAGSKTKVEDLAMAYAGNADAIESVVGKLEDAIQKEKESEETTKAGAEAAQKRIDAYQEQIDKIKGVQEETERAKEIEQDWLASGGAESLAKAEAIQGINDAYDEVVGSVTDFINAETGVLDVEAYLAAIDARSKALEDYQTNLAKSGLSTEQKDALNSMGVEAASAWLAGYQSATPEQQKRLKQSLTESAKDNSGVARKAIDDAFQKPVDAKVKAIADTESARIDLDNLIKARTAIIKVDFQDRNGKRVY
jgi:hypothetical protein